MLCLLKKVENRQSEPISLKNTSIGYLFSIIIPSKFNLVTVAFRYRMMVRDVLEFMFASDAAA